MSNYSPEPNSCTCDTPTGSENKRCSYCRSDSVIKPKRNNKMPKRKPTKTKRSGNGSKTK